MLDLRDPYLADFRFNLYPTNAPDTFKSSSYKHTKPPAI